jgi:endonuclease/exonuclease/phosphatase family metal-dependent hydrolase/ribonuclease HI
MNDEQLKDCGVLAISEPYARIIDGTLVTAPMGHTNWTKMIPTVQRRERWAFRSMLWIRKDIEAEQVPMQSSDLTAAVLRLPDRSILVVSVYVEPQDAEALRVAICELHQVIRETRSKIGTRVDVVLAGDFNQHDQLWGGEDVSRERQGEADLIIDLMSEHALRSLLPRGTKTWQRGNHESTIDLVLVSEELATSMVKYTVHSTEHGSDHRAIETIFDVATQERIVEARLLLKNAPWSDIRARIAASLCGIPIGGTVQQQTDRLMTVVLEAVQALTPRAKPSLYAKRWWTTDLTQLRRVYTYWRNQARTQRRMGHVFPDLEQQANDAAKEYHDAVRRQKKAHWDDFLADDSNIWQAAKYLDPHSRSAFDKIPPLTRQDGSTTKDKAEQAEELLSVFFPPLPARIEDEGPRPQRTAVSMPPLTMEEVERRIFAAKSWKAPGDDGLPAMVWKQVWPVVKERVLLLFQTSLDDGEIPTQWRNAKIIPLKKPNKGDYTAAKSWRPISLLSTLGKALESAVAERISHAVETLGLLPTNHFGARKKRSAEQALLLLQEHIYNAWRSKKVLSLVSFDVKGAYNGVYKDRLFQRLAARGIPPALVRWIDAFCSERTATILVNGHTSTQQQLPQAGLPQGSPLSPILFLFFNADLVQHKLSANGGSMAFVDDYNAWVTGPTAEANREGIQAIIDRAMEWERRSGATFEGDKTVIIHFTRRPDRTSTRPFSIKGEAIAPKETAKILGVIMDSGLRYVQHIGKATTKGLLAAMALKRLRLVSPSTARQLFGATVAPVVDYASNVWMHACGCKGMALMNRIQRIGAQAVTGAFRTVATAVAEAEASIRTVSERFAERATKFWVNVRTLPETNPISKLNTRQLRRFTSPWQKIAHAHQNTPTDKMEVIQPYVIALWEERLPATIDCGTEQTTHIANTICGIRIATTSSARKGIVGMGGAIHDTLGIVTGREPITYSVTLGTRTEQNPYTAELTAMAMAMKRLPLRLVGRQITIITSNQGALLAASRPRHQSGQSSIEEIYEAARTLRKGGNSISLIWIPSQEGFELSRRAKEAARQATEPGRRPQGQRRQAKSTIINNAITKEEIRTLPDGVGKYSKEMDTALPGKHTRILYDGLKRKEASVLAQLRTGMSRLNGYLHRIGAVESDQCECGQALETIRHFLFRYTRWDAYRTQMLAQTDTRRGNLSFYLGGKAPSDPETWTPNTDAVRATIKFAIATGRLDIEVEQAANTPQ